MVIFTVRVEDEDGQRIDEYEELYLSLPTVDEQIYRYLSDIDPYGNTIFNRQQVEKLLLELETLMAETKSGKEYKAINELKLLAEKCVDFPHKYLRFIGD